MYGESGELLQEGTEEGQLLSTDSETRNESVESAVQHHIEWIESFLDYQKTLMEEDEVPDYIEIPPCSNPDHQILRASEKTAERWKKAVELYDSLDEENHELTQQLAEIGSKISYREEKLLEEHAEPLPDPEAYDSIRFN